MAERQGRGSPLPARSFPWWGALAGFLGLATWAVAWCPLEPLAGIRRFTFSPLWLAYIVFVNALTYRQTGQCMMTHRPRTFLLLFPVSAVFWWYFEYLNRFAQNWYYVGISDMSPAQYAVFATLPFSTVLPAVLGTYEHLVASCPFSMPRGSAPVGTPLENRPPRTHRLLAAGGLLIFAAGLALIGLWPDYLFPLLWVSPLAVVFCLQKLFGTDTFVDSTPAPIRTLAQLALAALICGFFWEMWNSLSLAKWRYAVPFVNRFHLFEMPGLGYAGYLPFGLECAAIAHLCVGWSPNSAPRPPVPPGRTPDEPSHRRPRIGRSVACLLIASVLWLPTLHLGFTRPLSTVQSETGIPPDAQALAAYHLRFWSDPALRTHERARMRATNAEWDFMGRTFLVLSMANLSLRDPALTASSLDSMDAIIEETLRLEAEKGPEHFLMEYARAKPFIVNPPRSIFVDGEIALMLAARCLVSNRDDYRRQLAERAQGMIRNMEQSPVLCGESYPDECWVFCNSIALASIRLSDLLNGTDHSEFLRRWVQTARTHLCDPVSGMLFSSFSLAGTPYDGPEGSSIWITSHFLQLIDPVFAREQYDRARRHLGRSLLGFGYSREWPPHWQTGADVDSGPVIPILGVSAGASGTAFVGASAFKDTAFLQSLHTSLRFGGFPERDHGTLRFHASNQVGDSVILYSMVLGPLWQQVQTRTREGSR
jgi:hypothetical protein